MAVFRSKFEHHVALALQRAGAAFRYEEDVVHFEQPAKKRRYIPDFVLPNGIILEVKGYMTSADRSKHKWVKEQHPELDIRFVFQNPNTRISTRSRTRLREWAEKAGFQWCCGPSIPRAWLNENNLSKSKPRKLISPV
jgi:hypothetical protein